MNVSSQLPLLSANVGALGTTAKPGKLHEAAQQFEALMINEMLKSAHESGSEGWLGSGDGAGDDSAMGMAETQFAVALAKGGGLGLSQMIEKSMSQQTGPQKENTAAGALSNESAK